MEDLHCKLELVTEKLVTLVFVLLFVVQAIITSLLLVLVLLAAARHLNCSCPLSIVSSGIRSLPFYGAGLKQKDALAGYASAFNNVGIYTVSDVCPHSLTISEDDAMKPLYNSKFQNVDAYPLRSNSRLTHPWTSEEWRDMVSLFSYIFSDMMRRGVLEACAMALCIGAGKGLDVVAVVHIGNSNSGGSDVVSWPPVVVEGDMNSLPFPKDTFDFEFLNVFEKDVLTSQLATDIARTLKPGGCVAIHLMSRNSQSHESNSLQSIDALIVLFESFEIVHVGDIDAFKGLETEVIVRKPFVPRWKM